MIPRIRAREKPNYRLLRIRAPTAAVNGATRTSEKLPISVFTISAETSGELRKSRGCVACAANTIRSVREPPD